MQVSHQGLGQPVSQLSYWTIPPHIVSRSFRSKLLHYPGTANFTAEEKWSMSFSSASLCKQSTSAVLCDGKAVTSRWTQGVFSIRNAVSLELPFSLIPFNLVISLHCRHTSRHHMLQVTNGHFIAPWPLRHFLWLAWVERIWKKRNQIPDLAHAFLLSFVHWSLECFWNQKLLLNIWLSSVLHPSMSSKFLML